VEKTLQTIYQHNVLQFCSGGLGAVNGWVSGAGIDHSTVQSEEMWTGVSYGLASLMAAEGLLEEGLRTAEGVYRTVYETIGLGFETPEAIYEKKKYRSLGYMRPLALWGLHIALKGRRVKGPTALGESVVGETERKSSVLI
jgi:non-lysosomal glucosylceramidase